MAFLIKQLLSIVKSDNIQIIGLGKQMQPKNNIMAVTTKNKNNNTEPKKNQIPKCGNDEGQYHKIVANW